MPKRGANVSLSSYDEIFSTEETRSQDNLEKIQNLPLAELHPFQNHPFKVQRSMRTAQLPRAMPPWTARNTPSTGMAPL